MSIDTFTPPINPSVGAQKKPELKILEATFGDGYTQASADGLNHIRDSLTLNWEALTIAQSDAIEAFLNTQGGVTPFLWTAPGDATPRKWTCKDWEVTYRTTHFRSIKATFKQSFNIVI
ncbi:phage tail protein [Methylosinus sp. R-45379]|uniref:phage tail protein n=1 Tax=Methylosinus sp. R-45379 TaxID=980563 RepID=UPI0007C96566|nr:phage tail protein [Methylosinus sp. R-45379]